MGKTEDEILDYYFKSSNMPKELLKSCFHEHEKEIEQSNNHFVYDGFEFLYDLGKKHDLYLVSNCQPSYLEIFNKKYNTDNLFKNMLCLKKPMNSKKDNIKYLLSIIDSRQSFYIGDTASDFHSSIDLNLQYLHANYGHGKFTFTPEYSFNSLNDIIHYLNDL